MVDEWAEEAACKGEPTELFFSDALSDRIAAKAICASCPVRAPCGEVVRRNPSIEGVWGGTDEYDRGMSRRRARGPQERTCESCGQPFASAHGARYCSRVCRGEGRRLSYAASARRRRLR